jgi:ribonuclease D
VAELLTAPYEGLPTLITTTSQFEEMLVKLAQGRGPFAVDAERASGYRYSARAYLIQIKRTDGGLHLIDPIPFGDDHSLFHQLNELWSNEEVILHASTQDLPCLRELGLNPTRLFDTELAGRIAGMPRVALGTLTESLLEVSLAKEHSAQDWSIRPLPEDWLTYAALDVELLVDLRDEIEKILEDKGKLGWAEEEFSAILAAPAPAKRIDPWRRTSGSHKLRKKEELVVVRELWEARDNLARELDISQGRLLSDLAISTLAIASQVQPLTNKKQLEKALRPIGIRARWMEYCDLWITAIEDALAVPSEELPPLKVKGDGLPQIKIWRERFPEKYIPLSHARAKLAEAAADRELPVENLLTPELMRKICWNYGGNPTPTIDIARDLASWGARSWQIEITAPLLSAALDEREALVEPEAPDNPDNAENPEQSETPADPVTDASEQK